MVISVYCVTSECALTPLLWRGLSDGSNDVGNCSIRSNDVGSYSDGNNDVGNCSIGCNDVGNYCNGSNDVGTVGVLSRDPV